MALRGTLATGGALLIALALAPAASAQKSCAPKVPGGPSPAAVAQYCPDEVAKPSGGTPAAGPGGGATGTGSDLPEPRTRVAPTDQPTEIPLLGYPSSDGVNLALLILIAILALLAARSLYRRFGDGDAFQRAWSRISSRGAGG